MRAGQVIIVVGVLILLGGISTAVQSYDFNSQHDISKFAGMVGVAAVLIALGIAKLRKPPA